MSTLRTYHDGGMYAGQAYDDDQGGPLYVDGDEGVHLEPLSASDEVRARAEARELLNRIKIRPHNRSRDSPRSASGKTTAEKSPLAPSRLGRTGVRSDCG